MNKSSKLRQKAFKRSKEKMREQLVKRDNVIVHSVKVIDLIDKTVNLMTEQLKEWYALYFPELDRIVRDNDEYVNLINELKTRGNFTEQKIQEVVGDKGYAKKLSKASKDSMGGNLKEKDVKEIAKFSYDIVRLRNRRKNIETYLENVMREEARNVSTIIGPVIGARLISTAGSLKKLASMPSSTVQILGAEKALFAHIRKGTPSPKYGIIFQYPKLRGAPKPVRGKIARKLASKLSIGAKLDYFKGDFNGKKMKDKIEKYIEGLLEKNKK